MWAWHGVQQFLLLPHRVYTLPLFPFFFVLSFLPRCLTALSQT